MSPVHTKLQKTFRTFNPKLTPSGGNLLETFNLQALPTWNPQYTVEPKVVKLERKAKKNNSILSKTKTTPQLEVWICQKQLLFNAKALSRLPTSRSDVMSTPGSMVSWDKNKTKQHSQRLHNTMLKAIKISIRRKQRSFQQNQNSTTSQPEAEKVARNLRSSSLNL